MSLKYLLLFALLIVRTDLAFSYVSASQQSLAVANSKSFYLGNDLFYRYSKQHETAYIQNYKTLEIHNSKSVPELTRAYQFNDDVIRIDSSLILLDQNKRFDLNTFEVVNFPFPNIFQQVAKFNDDKYIALRFDKYCIFNLDQGCPDSSVQRFKAPLAKISYSDLYTMSETSQNVVFLSVKSQNLTVVSFDKNKLEWKVLNEKSIPYKTYYPRVLGTKNSEGLLFLAFLADRNDANQENSVIATWDLKNNIIKFKELDGYFDNFDMVAFVGKDVDLIGKELTGCWGQCPYQKSKNLRINKTDITLFSYSCVTNTNVLPPPVKIPSAFSIASAGFSYS